MPRGKKTPVDLKAVGVALLTAGNTPEWVASKLDLPLATVKSWGKKLPRKEAIVSDPFGPLLMELITSSLQALIAQQKVMSDPKWIERQRADQLGILQGITADKVIRLLAAANAAEDLRQRQRELPVIDAEES